jgi:hypothetical protein
LGERRFTLGLLGEMATLALAGGEPERAARLKGAEMAIRERLGIPLPPVDQAAEEEMLGAVEFARAWEQGRAMSLQEAVALALVESP